MTALCAILSCFLPAGHAHTIIAHDWAGYAWVGRPGTFRSIAATLTVPTAECSRNPWRGLTEYETAFWVGLDGYANDRVEQTGIVIECDPWGVAGYRAWRQTFPEPPVYADWTPAPGQPLKMSVDYSAGRFTLALGGWSTTVAGRAPRSSAEVIAEAPGNGRLTLPTAPFAPVEVSAGPPARSRPYRLILHDSGIVAGGGRVHSTITPGPLEGDRFSMTWGPDA